MSAQAEPRMLPFLRVMEGDALTRLRELPDEYVDCVVTSPPYWGLRDYKIPPIAWGGDRFHEHVWGPEVIQNASTNHVDKRRWAHSVNGSGEAQPIEKRVNGNRKEIAQGQFCECGAWLGSLGLEPTIHLYIEHMVEIFREVRRVLKPEGTIWLNIGDSYSNDTKWGGKSGGRHDRVEPGLHRNGPGSAETRSGIEAQEKAIFADPEVSEPGTV